MLYRVEEIQTGHVPAGVVPVLIGEPAIVEARQVSMEDWGYSDCGHEEAIRVVLTTGLPVYCTGTLETFAEPWEPEAVWRSVDDPPADGAWCWVTDGTSILKASWSDSGTSFNVDEERHVVYGAIIAWQLSNIPKPPPIHWRSASIPEPPVSPKEPNHEPS